MGRLGGLRAAGTSAALAVALAACASSPPGEGPVHLVRPGENLYRISLHYGVSVDGLIRANRIRDVRALEVGQALRVPGARKPPPAAPLLPPLDGSGEEAERALAEAGLLFDWPLRGPLSSGFGARRRGSHRGIDIPARQGAPIRAAEAGRVVRSERRRGGYGGLVVVQHAGAYSTLYAHSSRNLVRTGELVERGQVIALVGDTGNASGAHLHFEIRRDRRPEDPLRYLQAPGRERASLGALAQRLPVP